MPTHANPCGAATTWVVWANTWINTCCGFLGILLFFCFMLWLTPSPHTWTDFDDLYVIRRVSARMCLFGVSFIRLPILGVKSPKTPILGAWIGIFKLTCKILKFAYYRYYCTDYNRILHSNIDHQILLVGGPNTRKTNPRWRTAAMLKNRKSAISPEWFYRSSRNLARWRILGLRTGPVIKICNFWKSKMADGRHCE